MATLIFVFHLKKNRHLLRNFLAWMLESTLCLPIRVLVTSDVEKNGQLLLNREQIWYWLNFDSQKLWENKIKSGLDSQGIDTFLQGTLKDCVCIAGSCQLQVVVGDSFAGRLMRKGEWWFISSLICLLLLAYSWFICPFFWWFLLLSHYPYFIDFEWHRRNMIRHKQRWPYW